MPSVLDNLPPEYPDNRLQAHVLAAVMGSGRKVVALDDDPTGVQTVHDTAVLATWGVDDLAAELRQRNPVFYVLTNSRSLPEGDVAALNEEIVANLVAASETTGVTFAVASRSDSTLRGHFPAEPDAIARTLGSVDGVLLCPAFFEGGRYTVDDVHYVRDGERLVPAAETEFAKDTTFSYRHSNLRAWVEEKSGGRIRAADAASLPLAEIRRGGPDRVRDLLLEVANGQMMVVNAASYTDLFVVALGVIRAEAAGKRFVYRTAASFVRARAGLPERALLTRAELLGANAPPYVPGLVVVGSHVRRSSEQLARCLELERTVGIEVDVAALLGGDTARMRTVRRSTAATEDALGAGLTPVIYTSRRVAQAGDQLDVSRSVSAALVEIVRGIERRPGFIVGKGGITSSDVGTKALGARRALVLGQVRPGIPVWRLGDEARYPGLPYVVFPGNVGGPETLAEIVAALRDQGIRR